MQTEKQLTQNNIEGTWKLAWSLATLNYALPEYLIFKSKNVYTIKGKETGTHPLLDGGYYAIDNSAESLRINTANDAIKTYRYNVQNNLFTLMEEDKKIAVFSKETDLER
jgi:hypothetical protein